jgi:hypothetical protein
MDCGSLLPLSSASLLANLVLAPQQAVATKRQQAAAVHGGSSPFIHEHDPSRRWHFV